MDENVQGSQNDGPDLELVLMSNGVEVARSRDASAWISAMAAITGQSGAKSGSHGSYTKQPDDSEESPDEGDLAKFAKDIGIDAALLEAAADPSKKSPFIGLDLKYWDAFINTKGHGHTAPVALAATLLPFLKVDLDMLVNKILNSK